VLRLALVIVVALSVGACGTDAVDSATDSSLGLVPQRDAVALEAVGGAVFVTGDQGAVGAGGHVHSGPLVEDGQAHVHECLLVSNGTADDIVVRAIQALPPEGEKAYALFEAENLAAAFGVETPDQAVVPAGGAVALELLIPTDPADIPTSIRHRLAYSDLSPAGRKERFVEADPVGVTIPS